MKVWELIRYLQKQDPTAEVMPAAFYGPGSPTAETYEFHEHEFRTFKGAVWLAYDVPDRASRETLRKEGRKG